MCLLKILCNHTGKFGPAITDYLYKRTLTTGCLKNSYSNFARFFGAEISSFNPFSKVINKSQHIFIPSDSTSGPIKSIPTLYHTFVMTGSGCKGRVGAFNNG